MLSEETKINFQKINLKQASGDSQENFQIAEQKNKNAGLGVESTQKTECEGEIYLLSLKRWKKIANDYVKKNGTFDISKIPEVCDNIKFDLLHNPELASDFRLKLLSKS